MNFLNILRDIFKGRPSLQEFIEAHNPTDTNHVEFLEREYNRVYGPIHNYPLGS